MYKIGSSQNLPSIIPGSVTEVPEEKEDAAELPLAMLPRQTEEEEAVFTTLQPQKETIVEDKFTAETTSKIPTEYPTSPFVPKTSTIDFAEIRTEELDFRDVVTEYPESTSPTTPTYTYPELDQTSKPTSSEPQYLDEIRTTNSVFFPSELLTTIPETSETPITPEPRLLPVAPSFPESDPVEPQYTPEPRFSEIAPRFPESDPVEPHYTSPDKVQQVPPYSRSHQPQIVVVDEDEDLNVDGKKTSKFSTYMVLEHSN